MALERLIIVARFGSELGAGELSSTFSYPHWTGENMTKKTIVVTGACGYIAQRMWPELNESYDVVALDVGEKTGNGTKLPGVRVCDLEAVT